MTHTDQEMHAFAARVRAIMAEGDPSRIAAVFDPEAVIWENADGEERRLPEVGAFHHALAQRLASLEFIESEIIATSEGYIDRHVKRMYTRDGTVHLIPSCIAIALRDGRIYRVREYLDPTYFPAEVADARRAAHPERPGRLPALGLAQG